MIFVLSLQFAACVETRRTTGLLALIVLDSCKSFLEKDFLQAVLAFNYFQGLGDNAIPPILPKFIKRDGEWIGFLPGEEGYDNV